MGFKHVHVLVVVHVQYVSNESRASEENREERKEETVNRTKLTTTSEA